MLDNAAFDENVSRPPDDASYVVACLEEAGMTLLAMRASGYTLQTRCAWPDIVRDYWESYGSEVAGGIVVRMPRPTAHKISEMDAVLAWVSLIPVDRYVLRRIVHARALVHPVTERHLFPWRRLAGVIGASHEAVRYWHRDAIALIVGGLHRQKFSFPS